MSQHVRLVYQAHGVKNYDNRPLTNRSAMSIAAVLVNIFTQVGVGPPRVLQADTGMEFNGAAGKRIVLT